VTRFDDLIGRCDFPEHQFELDQQGEYWFLRVVKPGTPWKGRWWRLSEHMTDSEVVQTAWLAVLTWVEHEAREAFTFDGVTVFDPHLDVHELVRMRQEKPLSVRS